MGNFIVYKHTSPSGKCYVGITSQAPECRWGNDGCKYLEIHKNGKLKHPYFAQAILKYGWDNIKHELLHEKLSKEEACKLEQKYIIIKFINEAQDTSGGDGDEFYELVIKKITEETEWREGSTKAVLLIADAAPHKVGYSYKGIISNAQID